MTSAVSRVFSTPELLELILSHFPLPSLLLARRISPHFNTLITSSPLLQHALFIRPSSSPRLHENWTVNPLLRKHFLPFFAAPAGRFSSRGYSYLKLLDWTTFPASRDVFLRKDASWRNMALISRPLPLLRVVYWSHGQCGDSEAIAHIPLATSGAGADVTMGIVYDIVHDFLVGNLVASFGLAFQEDKKTGEMELVLVLGMTVQCCIYEEDEEMVSLRSEGEEVTIKKIKWDEKKGAGIWAEWSTDLDEGRGGVGDEELERWKKEREGVSWGDDLDAR